jgi:hypothetical protein
VGRPHPPVLQPLQFLSRALLVLLESSASHSATLRVSSPFSIPRDCGILS